MKPWVETFLKVRISYICCSTHYQRKGYINVFTTMDSLVQSRISSLSKSRLSRNGEPMCNVEAFVVQNSCIGVHLTNKIKQGKATSMAAWVPM
ncbi:uncharacterized protein LOC130770034 isoform X2 [Actinidia eriantha]|uniref:uncharacterized protein LOC130770034 isoform X2 n=1 Tax=Actinidia eriantha TaxID=165200 RepID=UPI0025887B42|nr:uncharacterized protein LOC130770034 isoform X2 [Actinidia eriantha]